MSKSLVKAGDAAIVPQDGYNRAALEAVPENTAMMAVVARERFELEAMMAQARSYPRDELECFQSMANAAKRPTFAAAAEYKFPRGGSTVSGLSVKAARPLALYWKYLRFGWKILRYDEQGFSLKGFAMDIQNGTMREQEGEGRWLQQRKRDGQTQWIPVTDERERRELMGRQGAVLERNCIAAVIPPDITEDFLNECRKTNVAAAKGDLAKNRQQVIRATVAAFGDFGVTSGMIEGKLRHPLDQINEDELAELRQAYNAIKDGEVRASEFFEVKAPTPSTTIDLAKATAGEAIDPPGGSPVAQAARKAPAKAKGAVGRSVDPGASQAPQRGSPDADDPADVFDGFLSDNQEDPG